MSACKIQLLLRGSDVRRNYTATRPVSLTTFPHYFWYEKIKRAREEKLDIVSECDTAAATQLSSLIRYWTRYYLNCQLRWWINAISSLLWMLLPQQTNTAHHREAIKDSHLSWCRYNLHLIQQWRESEKLKFADHCKHVAAGQLGVGEEHEL